jgi:hypothetical protein
MDDIEYSEIVTTGKRALKSLKDARASLDSARKWGVVDTVGGGLLSGWIKYGNIKDSKKQIEKAEHELQIFSNMLDHVSIPNELDIKIDGFIELIDLLRDNFLVDLIVQDHIRETIARLDEAISVTEQILNKLLLEDMVNYFKKNN